MGAFYVAGSGRRFRARGSRSRRGGARATQPGPRAGSAQQPVPKNPILCPGSNSFPWISVADMLMTTPWPQETPQHRGAARPRETRQRSSGKRSGRRARARVTRRRAARRGAGGPRDAQQNDACARPREKREGGRKRPRRRPTATAAWIQTPGSSPRRGGASLALLTGRPSPSSSSSFPSRPPCHRHRRRPPRHPRARKAAP